MDESTTETTSSSSTSTREKKRLLQRDKWERNGNRKRRVGGRGYVTKK